MMISNALNPHSFELQLTSFTMFFSKQLQITPYLYKALFTLTALKALPTETHKHKWNVAYFGVRSHQYTAEHANTKVSFTVWLYLSKTDFPAFQSLYTSSQQTRKPSRATMHIYNFREVPRSVTLLCSTQAMTRTLFLQAYCGSAEASPDSPRLS